MNTGRWPFAGSAILAATQSTYLLPIPRSVKMSPQRRVSAFRRVSPVENSKKLSRRAHKSLMNLKCSSMAFLDDFITEFQRLLAIMREAGDTVPDGMKVELIIKAVEHIKYLQPWTHKAVIRR